ncbi:MAG: anthranilate synthase component I [Thermodesulfobacteriaceae bacterium]|nr:anthranilate synthase component I [Thermodesulfobacteriaceae bacterium]
MEIYPKKEDFLRLSENFNVIPLYTVISADLETPISLFYKLFDEKDYVFLLESMEGPEKWARYSFIGFDPYLVFKSKVEKVSVEKGETKKEFISVNPWEELKKILSKFRAPQFKELPRFWGGAVGYVAYEMIPFFEKRVPRGVDTLNFNDLFFIFPKKLLIYDRLKHSYFFLNLCFLEEGRREISYEELIESLLALINSLTEKKIYIPKIKKELALSPELEENEFLEMVKRAKEYIAAGDIIQVVLSQRFFVEEDLLLNPHTSFFLYRGLRKINPSPYMFYLKLEDEVLIGASPEILIRVEDKKVETRPIAGTRKRGKTEEEDLALEEELLKDEKELAEHIMLVDLGRNDLGRVSLYGTVEAYELLTVERYSHVMHIVSGIKGILKEEEDMFSAFKASFPAGTVSGAPKIRAMEIISELEKKTRGPYAGAVGYFGFSQNMDFCITIRTFFQKKNCLYLQAGAGIVADSIPIKEYEETLNKAKALEKALELFSKGYFL